MTKVIVIKCIVMRNSISVEYSGKMSFRGELDGQKIRLDVDKDSGGEDKGIRPKPLMLVALAGCTGLDVVSLLRKMRVKYDTFRVDVSGELTEEHPRMYRNMHIDYRLEGEEVNRSKVEKAVNLSLDRYCGVAAVYKKVMPLTFTIYIKESKEHDKLKF